MALSEDGTNPSGGVCGPRPKARHVSFLERLVQQYFFPSVGIDPQRLSAGPAMGWASCTESQASTSKNTASLGAFKDVTH